MTEETSGPRTRKRWLIVLVVVLSTALLAMALLLPYLLKRYIESHSEEWINRRVTIDRIILNPFTFRYAATGVTCYEPHSEEVFVSWKDISVRINLWSGLRENDWRSEGLRIVSPYFHIVQDGDRFNFSDLLELGGDDTTTMDPASTTRFTMADIILSDGRIEYESDALAAPVGVKDLRAKCTLISSERARMDFDLGLQLEAGGRLEGGFMLDTELERYGINAQLRAFALQQLLPYLQDFLASKALTGAMDVDLNLLDSYSDTTGLAMSAGLTLSGVGLVDPNGERLFGLKQANARLDTLVARDQRVEMGEVVLNGAEIKFVLLNDSTDNWTRLLNQDSTTVAGGGTSTRHRASESNVFVLLADYIRYLGQQIVASEYTAKKLALTNSTVRFEDHTPAQPFQYTISGIDINANRITSDQEAGKVTASAVLQETGRLRGKATFDPKNIRNVEVDLTVDDLALNHLDAYGRWYAAHPLEDGVLAYATKTIVRDGRLDSQNHMRVDRLKVGRRVEEHDPGIYVLPLRLAAGLLKDVNGVVELDVPVRGDLKDPQFRVWSIVWQVLKNLLVKAASAPGRLLVRAVDGADEADLERVRFNYLQTGPGRSQEKTLRNLASALRSKPELSVDLVPILDKGAEVKEVAVFQAKKAFLFPDRTMINGADSTRIQEMNTRDSVFTAFVNERTPSLDGRSLHERCLALFGAEEAGRIAEEIEYARRESTMQVLLQEGVEAGRLRYRDGTAEELAGQRGVPGYRFVYGERE